GPIRSPNHPLGISNAAYAKVKALKIQPIWTVVSPSSDRIAGAEEAMHTRSMNVITDSTQAKYKRLYRARVRGMRDPGHGASKTRRGSSLIALAINVVDVPVPWCGRRRVFHRHLDDGGAVTRERLAQRQAEIRRGFDHHAMRAPRPRHRGEVDAIRFAVALEHTPERRPVM